ncbi:MAG: hypothetical protein GF344_13115, partial [Chitinivibrionales bacterium]|nr:hypothetical protein [Chitinivibrionales bacterium]MBD3357674.1 hypothetical protein [Chitinivibrionales bacterium]
MIFRRFAFALLLLAPVASPAGEADSLDYYQYRRKLLSTSEEIDSVLMETADELAQEGLYGDAMSLLDDLTGTIDTAGLSLNAAPSHSAERRPRGRVCFYSDYTRPEYVDTSTLTQEERDSVRRVLEEVGDDPFYTYLAGSVALFPAAAEVRKVEPSLHVSNRKI